jgi:hypothetical protein
MRYTTVGLLLITILAALVLAGCGNKYLVPGLSLPPGSSEVDFQPGAHSPNAVPLPAMGEIKRSVTSSFNNGAGWESVAAHIDRCLSRAGYGETMSNLAGMAGQEIPGMGGAAIGDMMRMYTKAGGKYAVMLTNNQSMMGAAGAGAAAAGAGDFTLVVMEYKGD